MNRSLLTAAMALLILGGASSIAPADVLRVSQDLAAARVYPNPWRADRDREQSVNFVDLPASAVTSLRIYTIAGEHVRSLSGTGHISWNLRNNSGDMVASGVYLYLLTTNAQQKSGKIAVIR